MSKYDKIDADEKPKMEFFGKMDSVKDIKYALDEVENEYGVDVLYASLVGSRAFGYPNKYSDYKVRFVYIRPIDDYLKVCPQPLSIRFNQYKYHLVGWDLKRVLRQHYLSNPLLYDWFNSPMVYVNDKIGLEELMPFDRNILSKWFYLISQHSYNKSFKDIPHRLKLSDVRNYLTTARYILMWNVLHYNKEYPPVTMKELLMLNEKIDSEFIEFIVVFMDCYKSLGEKEFGYHELSHINSWINNSLRLMGNTYPLRPPTRKDCYYYNKRFLDLVK